MFDTFPAAADASIRIAEQGLGLTISEAADSLARWEVTSMRRAANASEKWMIILNVGRLAEGYHHEYRDDGIDGERR
jgi:hypothetical protein